MKHEWQKNPKMGVRIGEDGYPDPKWGDIEHEGTIVRRKLISVVYPQSSSFSPTKWRVFDSLQEAQDWLANPFVGAKTDPMALVRAKLEEYRLDPQISAEEVIDLIQKNFILSPRTLR